jgi:hypothetical protein
VIGPVVSGQDSLSTIRWQAALRSLSTIRIRPKLAKPIPNEIHIGATTRYLAFFGLAADFA